MTASPTIFEHPLSEKVRTYLRLEFLFNKTLSLINDDSYFGHHAAVGGLFELLEVLDHGDTRADLHSDLDKQLQLFRQMASHPNIDREKLHRFLSQLEKLYSWIVHHRGKFGALLREDEFLQLGKQRFALRGGSSPMDLPRLHCFLLRDAEWRREKLSHWLNELQGVRTSVEVLLRLLREQAHWRDAQFDEGYFHLEPVSGHLLRIQLIEESGLFPEVSSGPRRCVIRLCEASCEGSVKFISKNARMRFAVSG
jgi:cell division protein ZapD